MTRAVARLAVARVERDGAVVVDELRRRALGRESHVGEQLAEVHELAGARRGGDELGLGR